MQPDGFYFPYYRILNESTTIESWWNQYVFYHSDYLYKTAPNTTLARYICEAAPPRWYSRSVINIYTPVERASCKIFFRVTFDLEPILLGSVLGMLLFCRHFLDVHLCKNPEFRPGDSVCTGRRNHFYPTWGKSHVNPRKYIDHEKRRLLKKLIWASPHALLHGFAGAFACHVFSSQLFTTFRRHWLIFGAVCFLNYEVYYNKKKLADMDLHYNLYKHLELYGLALLALYGGWRCFRSFSNNVPLHRVMFG